MIYVDVSRMNAREIECLMHNIRGRFEVKQPAQESRFKRLINFWLDVFATAGSFGGW
jgi:hypothetical protein